MVFTYRIHKNSHIPTWRVLLCPQLWKEQISEPSTHTLGLDQGLLCFLANKELRDLHILFPCSAAGPVLCWEKRIYPAIPALPQCPNGDLERHK